MDEIKINEKFYSISDSWNAVIAECEFLRKRYKKILENEKELLEIGDFDEAKKADIMSKRYLKALIRKLP